MKKILSIGALLVGIAVLAALLYLRSNLDGLVARAIEEHGSAAVGTAVRVGGVSIDLAEGKGTIRGLRVANPNGFPGDDAFRLGEITLQIDATSVTKSPIVIPQVSILDPEVESVMGPRGRSNLDVLLANVQSGAGGSKAKPSAGDGGAESKPIQLSIGRFRFEEGRVAADLESVGGETFETGLPPVRVNGLRGTPDQIAEALLKAFLRSAASAVAKEQAGNLIEENLEGDAGRAARGLLDQVLD